MLEIIRRNSGLTVYIFVVKSLPLVLQLGKEGPFELAEWRMGSAIILLIFILVLECPDIYIFHSKFVAILKLDLLDGPRSTW